MRKLPLAMAALALAATACNGSSTPEPSAAPTSGGAAAKPLAGTSIEITSVWTGEEQKNFEQVLKAFEDKTGAKVTYASTGQDTNAYLGPRIEAGNPPDVAVLSQPGLI